MTPKAPDQPPFDEYRANDTALGKENNTLRAALIPRGTLPLKRQSFAGIALGELRYIAGNIRDETHRSLHKEFQHRDVFAWIPVFMALGALGYFVLPREPHGVALGLSCIVVLFATWLMRRTNLAFRIALCTLLFVGGAGLAKWQTERLSTPRISQAGTYDLRGVVAELIPGEKRTRLVLRDATHVARSPEPLAGIQLSAFNQHVEHLRVGDITVLKARLEPLSGPVIPNGYDFRRVGYFSGLSARGFLLGEALPELSFSEIPTRSFADTITQLRVDISYRLTTAIPGEGGALAAALLVGDRSHISEEVQEALRRSGLAHVLAISGLHMALVTALLFGAVRIVAAFAENLFAQYEAKKWAAGTALTGAITYLALSGAAVSAQRAFLMAAIFLIAIMCNRAALTMRNVALAAIVILCLQPSAVLTPGFQMSFMAVVALVAVYRHDGLFARTKERIGRGGIIRACATASLGLAFTSVIAGLATSPFAVHHFYQAAIFGLAGNLVAMPIVGFIVMPMGILALLLMPFGLEAIPLALMDIGLWQVVRVAEWVSNLEGAVTVPGQQPAVFTLLVAMSFLCLCLMRTRLRFAFFACAILAAVAYRPTQALEPIMLISEDAEMVASLANGDLQFHGHRRNKFIAGIWLRAMGSTVDQHALMETNGNNESCDDTACLVSIQMKNSQDLMVAMVTRAEAVFEVCHSDADIVVSSLETEFFCPIGTNNDAVIVDKKYTAQHGSIMLTVIDKSISHLEKSQTGSVDKFAALGLSVETGIPTPKRPWN